MWIFPLHLSSFSVFSMTFHVLLLCRPVLFSVSLSLTLYAANCVVHLHVQYAYRLPVLLHTRFFLVHLSSHITFLHVHFVHGWLSVPIRQRMLVLWHYAYGMSWAVTVKRNSLVLCCAVGAFRSFECDVSKYRPIPDDWMWLLLAIIATISSADFRNDFFGIFSARVKISN